MYIFAFFHLLHLLIHLLVEFPLIQALRILQVVQYIRKALHGTLPNSFKKFASFSAVLRYLGYYLFYPTGIDGELLGESHEDYVFVRGFVTFVVGY